MTRILILTSNEAAQIAKEALLRQGYTVQLQYRSPRRYTLWYWQAMNLNSVAR